MDKGSEQDKIKSKDKEKSLKSIIRHNLLLPSPVERKGVSKKIDLHMF